MDVYSEHTGLDRFSGPAYESRLLTFYEQKYSDRQVDLLIVVGASALDFVLAKKLLEGTGAGPPSASTCPSTRSPSTSTPRSLAP